MRGLFILTVLFTTQASAEQKFFVDGQEVALNTSEATDAYIRSSASDLEAACKGYLQIEAALKDFTNVTEFPLPNNSYPASDTVSGFLELANWGRGIGYHPASFPLIWENFTADGDKAFSQQERDNVVALWTVTTSRTPLNCQEGS